MTDLPTYQNPSPTPPLAVIEAGFTENDIPPPIYTSIYGEIRHNVKKRRN